MRVFRHVNRFHGARVEPREVHHRGQASGRRVEIRHLLGVKAHVANEFGQLNGLFHGRPRVRGHKVGNDELLLARAGVLLLEQRDEALVDRVVGLAHARQDAVGNVLGRDAELPAHVVLGQLAHELPPMLLIEHHVVEADARANEHLLHAGNLAQLAQESDVVGMVGDELPTWFGC